MNVQVRKPPLLIVEDDPGLQSQMRWSFANYDVRIVGDRDSALTELRSTGIGVVLLDLGLPPDPSGTSEGFAALEQIIAASKGTKVIVVTGHDDHQSALKAISLGAYDFINKPVESHVLDLMVSRAQHVYGLEQENKAFAAAMATSGLYGVIYASSQMAKICEVLERIAPSNVSVLLTGASGTGKELMARALHNLSARATGPFVAINCGAIPENLLETELFGHEKGAFTGAVKQLVGKIEMANAGTLFLDEIGDLPLALQVKLLRFVQERVIERVGGRKEIPVDVRIVCATHQDLEIMIAEGRFREDLYYRISEMPIRIPALAERAGDAELLARSFLLKFSNEFQRPVRGFSTEALIAISRYTWPGNVRELENRIKRGVIMSEGQNLSAADLDLESAGQDPDFMNLRRLRDEADRSAIHKVLAITEGNVTQAAKMLGVSRPTLYDLMRQHNIKE
jgi:two-component system, NtrC family, response regulator